MSNLVKLITVAAAVVFFLTSLVLYGNLGRRDRDVTEARELLEQTVRVEVHHLVDIHVVMPDGTELDSDEPQEYGGFGSGFVAEVRKKKTGVESLVVTASHVCHTFEIETKEMDTIFGKVKITAKTKSIVMKVMTSHGDELEASTLFDDERNDMCILRVIGRAGKVATLADSMPEAGARLIHTGAPMTLFGDGLGAVVDGRSMGILKFGESWYLGMMLATRGGSSGGPVWYNGEVVGTLVLGSVPDGNITFAIEVDHIRSALIEARVKWPRVST